MHNVISLSSHLEKKSGRPVESDSALPPSGTQLALPFIISHTLVLILTSHLQTAKIFRCFLEQLQPHCVLDIRIAPRMDVIGTNRAQAFQYLESRHTAYVDVLGRIESTSGKGDIPFEFVSIKLNQILNSIEIKYRPLFVLFDDATTLRRFSLELRSNYDVVVAERQTLEEFAHDFSLLQM